MNSIPNECQTLWNCPERDRKSWVDRTNKNEKIFTAINHSETCDMNLLMTRLENVDLKFNRNKLAIFHKKIQPRDTNENERTLFEQQAERPLLLNRKKMSRE